MTITAKENIPAMTTAMNANITSSSSNAPESTAATDVVMKEDMAAKDVVETTENTTEETSVQQKSSTTVIESPISKKRSNTETLNPTDGSTDHVVLDDDTGDIKDESPTTTSTLLESVTDKVDSFNQQQQLGREDDTSHPAANDGSDDRTSSEVVAVPIDLQRPVKRARTAYFLFLDDFRSTVQKEVKMVVL